MFHYSDETSNVTFMEYQKFVDCGFCYNSIYQMFVYLNLVDSEIKQFQKTFKCFDNIFLANDA